MSVKDSIGKWSTRLSRSMGSKSRLAAVTKTLETRAVGIAYQPIVDLTNGKVFAYEALARPKLPDFQGPLPLIAAAVKHGMIGRLGRMLRSLAVEGCPDAPLFLNVHPGEFGEGWLVRPDDPIFNHERSMFVEITESVPISHFEMCHSVLKEIRGKGVSLVVDDLGAGYSNLKYISDLAPEVVKLDRELIAGLDKGTRLHKLVVQLVRLCTELGARVVAEGIETESELNAAIDAGAHFGQGYFLARPANPLPEVSWRPQGAEDRSDS